MKRGSSHHGDTTGNTYTDLGAVTEEAMRISRTSREMARTAIGNSGGEDRIRQRCSIAVGDFAMADLLRFCHVPVEAGIHALDAGAGIVTDIRMVQVGIQKAGHSSRILCALDHGREIADRTGVTRSSAGLMALAGELTGAIVVIGNAPSALLALCRMVAENGISPALVIGTPVGFVNAAESKALLRTLALPSITTEGTRGGTPVAVAAMNEIITIRAEEQDA